VAEQCLREFGFITVGIKARGERSEFEFAPKFNYSFFGEPMG
jgi:hypothetical protein